MLGKVEQRYVRRFVKVSCVFFCGWKIGKVVEMDRGCQIVQFYSDTRIILKS